MAKRCSVCNHERINEINKAIANDVSYRNIALQWGLGWVSVYRHVRNCLQLDWKAVGQNQQLQQKINVYDEFCEQLEFAKDLRTAAKEYLSNPINPLKMSITPKAHEIEVTYFDHNDMEIVPMGNKVIERPKKKTAQLSVILESFQDQNLHPEKFKVTTIDIRKFALEAIDRADMCIDRFARMGGDYTKERDNPETVETALASFNLWLDKNPDASQDSKLDAIKSFASWGKVSEEKLRERAGVTVIDAVQ